MTSLRSRTWCVLVAGALSCALAAQAAAQSKAGAESPLAAAVEAAWQRAVQSVQAQGRLARAQASQVAAESIWAAPPALELSHRDDRFNRGLGRRETEVGLAWPLLLPGQRNARINTAQAELQAAEAGGPALRLRIAGEVRESAWAVTAGRAELAIAAAQARTLRALADDVARRVQAGDLARADELAVRGELAAAVAAETEAQQRLDAAESRWRVLTGMEPLTDAAENAGDGDIARHPELVNAARAVEHARTRLDLVRNTSREPPDLILSYRHDTSDGGVLDQDSVGIALRIPFGTKDRNVPREAAAVSELEVAQATERRLRENLNAEAATARSAFASAARQLEAEQTRHTLLQERALLIEKSFRAGETPLPELLRALAAAALAEGGVARQRAELGLARARLNQSLGILP